jgi:hypothetical protein
VGSARAAARPPLSVLGGSRRRPRGEDGKAWMRGVTAWAHRCRIPGFTRLPTTLSRYRKPSEATLDSRPSNRRAEALNAQVNALITRARGFRSAAAPMNTTGFVHGGPCPDSPYAQASNRYLKPAESRGPLRPGHGMRPARQGTSGDQSSRRLPSLASAASVSRVPLSTQCLELGRQFPELSRPGCLRPPSAPLPPGRQVTQGVEGC